MKLSKRFIPQSDLELRNAEGEPKKISGYGIVYNRKTQIYDDLYEIIRPGAARKILEANSDIKCALNHDNRFLFGRTKSGTLQLEENQTGVKYTVTPPDTGWARDAMVSIERRDIDGSSFTFGVTSEGEKITKQKDGSYLREIFEFARIGEMGPVTDPAYITTTAELRSAQEEYEDLTADVETHDNEADKIESMRTLEHKRRMLDLKSKY